MAALGCHAPQHLDAAGGDDEPAPGRLGPGGGLGPRGVELRLPSPAPRPAWEHEGDVFMMGVEEQQEAVVADPAAARVGVWHRVAVEEDAE